MNVIPLILPSTNINRIPIFNGLYIYKINIIIYFIKILILIFMIKDIILLYVIKIILVICK